MTTRQKTCSEDLEIYKDKILKELKDKKVYGGFEGKLEYGQITYFKHWIGKKA